MLTLSLQHIVTNFVSGYLEEEAVLTYTRQIKDIEDGKLPMWEKMQAPDIAIHYYQMPEGKQTMKDLLLYIRADEAKHREVNHTVCNTRIPAMWAQLLTFIISSPIWTKSPTQIHL